MKIGLVQLDIHLQNKQENFLKIKKLIKERAEVDLLLFPEMSLTGFSMDVEASLKDSEFFNEEIKKMAKQEQVMIGYGAVRTNQQTNYAQNHYIIIDKLGHERMDYRKIHPFSFVQEETYYQAGDQIVLEKLEGFMCSTFICYDLRFPELFQSVSKKADLIIVPANWPKERANHWRALLIARAIENQVYIAGINCVGTQDKNEYVGGSLLVDPTGKVLREGSAKEEILYDELDNDIKSVREAFPVHSDRKVELYKKLLTSE